MSGYSDKHVARHGLRPGEHFLEKLFAPDDLDRKLREMVSEGADA